MPTRTRQADGTWVNDPIPQAKTTRASAPVATAQANLKAQRDSLIETMRAVSQCSNIAQVRKCLEHGRQTYPK